MIDEAKEEEEKKREKVVPLFCISLQKAQTYSYKGFPQFL